MRIVQEHNRIVRGHNRIVREQQSVNLRCAKNKTHRIRKTGPMRLEQGLVPCQFIVRLWLPVF